MTTREEDRARFLEDAGWGAAQSENLAGDASNRRYFRLMLDGNPAVLMDAPPEKGEDVRPFVKIAAVLRANDLSAPKILAEDHSAGFLLLEDLGDDLFARVLAEDPSKEEALYLAATDALIKLHQTAPPADIAPYDAATMADLAGLAFDWYATGVAGENSSDARNQFVAGFAEVLDGLDGLTEVLIQRDYHAENLLWVPERSQEARVGLLDFQDARSGHRAYDLVSLLQDARRDVLPKIEVQMLDHYVTSTGVDRAAFVRAYALLGLQRNLRIIGVFARLCMRDSKPTYIDLIPRVWAHMLRDLNLANLGELETVLEENLPHPSAATLEVLKTKCGTARHQ